MVLKKIFTPEKIGTIKVKNRIIRSATYMKKAEHFGEIGKKYINYYSELAKGGIGLIITGYISVDISGNISSNQPALYDDSFIFGHRKLVEAIHDNDSKIIAQIGHPGRQGAHPDYHPFGPSPIINKFTGLTPREMNIEEIHQYIEKFANAGERAFESGYDGVQLHAAHGYLLSNFLSPFTNQRDDEFGGNIKNRTRILIEIYNMLRDKVGNSFPIIIKLQAQDFVPYGLHLEEGIEIAKLLVKVGYDAIEPSGGIPETQIEGKNPYPSRLIKNKEDENYFLSTALKLKPFMMNAKLILMGGIRDPYLIDQILINGNADFISMSRPFIHEPYLVNRWIEGDLSPSKCNSCNSCYIALLSGETYCMNKKKKIP